MPKRKQLADWSDERETQVPGVCDPAVGRWYSRSGNGVCLTASAANCDPANDSYRNEPAADMLSRPVCLGCFWMHLPWHEPDERQQTHRSQIGDCGNSTGAVGSPCAAVCSSTRVDRPRFMAPSGWPRRVLLGALAIVRACRGVALFPLSYRTEETPSECRSSFVGLPPNGRRQPGYLSRCRPALSFSATFGGARAVAWFEN